MPLREEEVKHTQKHGSSSLEDVKPATAAAAAD
jgi:hypothetical protein